MAVVNNTPSINATGAYRVATPFTVDESAIYVAEAIDGFNALESRGIDVYAEFYQPHSIPQSRFNEDKAADINIITLISNTAATVFVPSSYITSFPNTGTIGYSQLIVSLDMGLLPDNLNMDSIFADVAQRIAANTGVTVNVQLHSLVTTDVVDYDKHQLLEAARLANLTFSESLASENIRLTSELESRNERITQLEEALIAAQ